MKKTLLLAILILILNWVISPEDPLYLEEPTQSKSLDAYWSETQLGSQELESLLTDESCQNEKKSFLSCVNSINQMADRFSMTLDKDFTLRAFTNSQEKAKTEKAVLKSWSEDFDKGLKIPRFSFLLVFKTIMEKEKNPVRIPGLIASGINGFFSVYRDPHTYIIPIQYFENVLAKNEFQSNFTGFLLRKHKDEVFVRKVFDESPASQAGLQRGDKILRVNQHMVHSMTYENLLDFLRKPTVPLVQLEIERKIATQIQVLKLKFVPVEKNYPNVTSQMIQPMQKIGLITVHKFSKNTCTAVKSELIHLKELGLNNLVLDLRDNPGGQVDEAACLIGLFVESGTFLFEMVLKEKGSTNREKYTSTQKPLFSGRLAVLINSGSASASEIVAGALKDLKRAVLVGEQTFGKGSFQDGRMWGQSSQIALFETAGLYYFPSGWTPQLVGIEPDIKVASLGFQAQREEELYYNPLLPFQNKIPTVITSLRSFEALCDGESQTPWLAGLSDLNRENDIQFKQAQKYLNCSSFNQSIGQN